MKAIMKLNNLRKKQWSAPATMTVFILICMLIVFSMEALGLTNKEKNLQLRKMTYKEIKFKHSENYMLKINESDEFENFYDFMNELKEITTQDLKLKTINILLSSAIEQYKIQHLRENSMKELSFYDN